MLSIAQSQTKPRISRIRTSAPADSLIGQYFQDVGALAVLQPQQEFELAQNLEALEVELWAHLLTGPELARRATGLAQQRLGGVPPALALLVRRGRSRGAQRAVSKRLYEKAARQVRAADVDRLVLDEVLDHIRRRARHQQGGELAQRLSGREGVQFVRRALSLGSAAQRARDRFIQANLRLVVTIARRFNFGDLPLSDLIQEGNIGLIKAVGRYDHRRGFRFSTYASWWIRHAITRAIADKGRLVRVPVHMLATVRKVARTTQDLGRQLGRAPTADEVGSRTAMSSDEVMQSQEVLQRQPVSLEHGTRDDAGRPFIEMIQADDERPSPTEAIGNRQVYAQVREILDTLSPMELDILHKRFGLRDEREHTLVEIGATYDLSRERIRQIQERALGKIRFELERRRAV